MSFLRENHKIDNRGEFLDFLSSPCGQENRRNRWQWCWWQRYVGDFMMVTDSRCWWQNNYVGDFFRCVGDFLNVLNRSPTSQTCHQHTWSPTSVTNIDVTVNSFTGQIDRFSGSTLGTKRTLKHIFLSFFLLARIGLSTHKTVLILWYWLTDCKLQSVLFSVLFQVVRTPDRSLPIFSRGIKG